MYNSYKIWMLVILTFVVGACHNSPPKAALSKKQPTDTANKQTVLTDSLPVLTDSLPANMFPIEDYLFGDKNGDAYKFGQFYLRFMAAAKSGDKQKVVALIHFPFQTTKQKGKYNKKVGDYEAAGAEDWEKGLLDEKQFNSRYDKIFSKEVLESIPETRQKDVGGYLPGNVEPGNDYDARLQAFTDKGSNIYFVDIELPIQKRNYGFVHFAFGRVNGEYKVLSYFLQ